MPHPCVVCGRSRMNPKNRDEDYMFFGFPVSHDERCQKWLEFCCREDLYKLTKKQLLQRMICSKHFDTECFVKHSTDRLNCSAVPTIYDPKQSLYNIVCILCGKYRKDPPGNDYDGTTFHHFPGEEFRCLKWLDFVGIESYYRLTRKEILYCYLCSNHFDKSQFINGSHNRLISNAVPNIRNPQEMNGTEQFIMEILPDPAEPDEDKTSNFNPLPHEVLESQACAACGRSRSDPRNRTEKYKFHPFPAYEIGRCLRWCQFLGREDILKMSPNQIRKLVLCSKHFNSGQSLSKSGCYDAVPTIKDISQDITENSDETILGEFDEIVEELELQKTNEEPLVSSRKPPVANKPKPLAKKRGKTRRSTQINIPTPDNNINPRVLRKLPLPPASSNCDIWNLQIPNQIQPIIANNLTPITNAVNKVILPFTGNISDFGKPIPVSSLSSIPPGLLIKIDLPQETQNDTKRVTRRTAKKEINSIQTLVKIPLNQQKDETTQKMVTRSSKKNNSTSRKNVKDEIAEEDLIKSEGEDYDSPELIDNDFQMDQDNESAMVVDCYDKKTLTNIKDSVEIEILKEYEQIPMKQKVKITNNKIKKRRMNARGRRSMIPIQSQVEYFMKQLKPHMRKLPKNARARVKLSIVNRVIDNL